MTSRNGVVVARDDQAASLRERQATQAIDERLDKGHLPLDLDVAPITRRNVDAHDDKLARPHLKHHCGSTAGQRYCDLCRQVLTDGDSAGQQNAALPRINGVPHTKAARVQSIRKERSPWAATCLCEHNDVIATRPQPSEDAAGTYRSRGTDVEGEHAQRRGKLRPHPSTGSATWPRTRAFGLSQCRHELARAQALPATSKRPPPAFDGSLRFPASPRGT